jgi:predicted metal-dependent phosphoesterase TrpH
VTEIRVDLHSHTTASDGALSPRELVRLAARHRVSVLAITDHDSTEGLVEAMDEAARHGIEIVPGLEINCDVPGAEIHVLGYCMDWRAPWFQDFLREQRAERVARVHRIVDRLTELGLPLTADEVFAVCKEGSPGRPHVAQAMIARGYVKSVREAFDRYLHAGGPANVPRRRLTPVDAVGVIRRAGGTRWPRSTPTVVCVASTDWSRPAAPTTTARTRDARPRSGARPCRPRCGRSCRERRASYNTAAPLDHRWNPR